mgnify:FL=1
MELYISIIGAIVAIIVSVLGAILANKNTIILQTRKLKEEHYIAYIEALHNYAASDINDKDALKNYVYMRDKLLLIANEKVIIKLLEFEDVIISAASKGLPHLVANYLFELAGLFHSYYSVEKIVTDDEIYTKERIALINAVKVVINNAAYMLGLILREEM